MSEHQARKLLADRIRRAKNLRDLHDALIAFEDKVVGPTKDTMYEKNSESALAEEGIDICELPVFGGPEPRRTAEVWSWDHDRILAGVGPFRDWHIEQREDDNTA